MLDNDLDIPDPNPLSWITLVYFKSESLVKIQSVVVASGPYEASVMRSVAGAPPFIQLESEEKLTGIEGLAGFRGNRLVSRGGHGRSRQAFNSKAWRITSIISFVTCFKADKSDTV